MTAATVTVRNHTELRGAPESILHQIREAMTLENPKYSQAERFGRYTGALEPEIELWEDIPDGVAFPRGWTRHTIVLLQRAGIHWKINDQRRALDPLSFSFVGKLRDYQSQAVQDVLSRDFGVLESGTGSGKTVMALAVIAERQQPTLILVHNKELLHQWRERIKAFLALDKVGQIGDGKAEVRPVTVGIVNSVKKRLDSLSEGFGHLVVDECHRTPSTMFTEAVRAFDCRFMLGLSATAYRRDGLTRLIYLTLGDRVHQVDPALLQATGAVLAPEIIRRETVF